MRNKQSHSECSSKAGPHPNCDSYEPGGDPTIGISYISAKPGRTKDKGSVITTIQKPYATTYLIMFPTILRVQRAKSRKIGATDCDLFPRLWSVLLD
jgi:hypothetical protein